MSAIFGRKLRNVTAVLLVAVLSVNLTGCVSRRLTIRSDPPGALVEVDGKRVGNTPVAMDFDYYGTREVILSMPGYDSQRVMQPVRAPWYQYFPIEFFADNFTPYRVTDRHDFTYRLQPRRVEIEEDGGLLSRANGVRSEALMGQ